MCLQLLCHVVIISLETLPLKRDFEINGVDSIILSVAKFNAQYSIRPNFMLVFLQAFCITTLAVIRFNNLG